MYVKLYNDNTLDCNNLAGWALFAPEPGLKTAHAGHWKQARLTLLIRTLKTSGINMIIRTLITSEVNVNNLDAENKRD